MLVDVLKVQRNEITEYYVYKNIAKFSKNSLHKSVLEKIADEELMHYGILKNITKTDIKPDRLKIFFYTNISKIFGLNFGLKLMEKNEKGAENLYKNFQIKSLAYLELSEKEHENKLISMIEEEKLNYISSIVLGFNDALVELTGALSGFTFALSNSKLIAIVGFITGVAASMSMGVSNYLSIKNDESREKHPFKSALYTFFAYLLTVILLIVPYLLIDNVYISLSIVLITVVFMIAAFNFYTSIAKGLNFKKRFLEMFVLSMSVALINYFIGYLIKKSFNVDI